MSIMLSKDAKAVLRRLENLFSVHQHYSLLNWKLKMNHKHNHHKIATLPDEVTPM